MAEWSVVLEAKANEKLAWDDPRIDELTDLLGPHSGTVAFGGEDNVVAVTMSGKGRDALDASRWAAQELLLLLEKVNLSVGPLARLEAVGADVLSAELEQSNFPDLVGTTEAANLLGVSRQRLHQLRAAGNFPEPMVILAATPIWLRAAIEGYFEQWPRRPGRPPQGAFSGSTTGATADLSAEDVEQPASERRRRRPNSVRRHPSS